MSWRGAAQARQRLNLKRLQERMEKQTPTSIPCDACRKLVPAKNMIRLDKKVLCEECYTRLYREKDRNV